MKKLMIAAAIVCAAAVSQAAVANWKATGTEIHDGTGVEESYYSGTAYIFDSGLMSQAALFDIISGGGTISDSTTGLVGKGTVANGSLGQEFSHGEQGGGNYSYYFVLVESDMAYFSNIKSVAAGESAASKAVGFGDQYDWDAGLPPNSMALPTEGYQGAGAWAATAVPEPTSGLLLLLGVAGLALKRRRA